MSVSKDTLKAMIRDLGGVPMTEEQLDIVLPAVQAHVEAMATLDEVDLSEVLPGHIFRIQPDGEHVKP
ncbi:MAG: hypothetical protein O6920_03005 [Chloroflexi bacterium]|nr:hypothetical protein [Chloroflexota bacterium]